MSEASSKAAAFVSAHLEEAAALGAELAVLVDDDALRAARLVLVRAVQLVLKNGLEILGIEAPERMDRTETPDRPELQEGT